MKNIIIVLLVMALIVACVVIYVINSLLTRRAAELMSTSIDYQVCSNELTAAQAELKSAEESLSFCQLVTPLYK